MGTSGGGRGNVNLGEREDRLFFSYRSAGRLKQANFFARLCAQFAQGRGHTREGPVLFFYFKNQCMQHFQEYNFSLQIPSSGGAGSKESSIE